MHRYVEIAGELRRVLSVVKVRGSKHSKQIRFFDVDSDKITIGEPLLTYQGILSDRPTEID
jgi:circadian clock protein KaiC